MFHHELIVMFMFIQFVKERGKIKTNEVKDMLAHNGDNVDISSITDTQASNSYPVLSNIS